MKKPNKISEEILIKNWYIKIIKKIFSNEKWILSNFLISSHDKKTSIWTMILPITLDNKIILLEEYRYWPEEFVFNFPVWMLEDWISEIDNSINELEEETWYSCNKLSYLWESIVENYFEWKVKYYIAKDCYKKQTQHLDKWENINIHLFTKNEFENLIKNWVIKDSKTVYCYTIAKFNWLI